MDGMVGEAVGAARAAQAENHGGIEEAPLFTCDYEVDLDVLERYARLRESAAEMIACKADISVEKARDLFCCETGYQTPKVDTRAAVFQDGRQLSGESRNDGEPLLQPRGASGKPCGGEGHEGAALDVLRREGRSKPAAGA